MAPSLTHGLVRPFDSEPKPNFSQMISGTPVTEDLVSDGWTDLFKKVSEEEFAQEQVEYRARFPWTKQWTKEEWIRHNRKWTVKGRAECTSCLEFDTPQSDTQD